MITLINAAATGLLAAHVRLRALSPAADPAGSYAHDPSASLFAV